jgi:hypothetical protein
MTGRTVSVPEDRQEAEAETPSPLTPPPPINWPEVIRASSRDGDRWLLMPEIPKFLDTTVALLVAGEGVVSIGDNPWREPPVH